MANLTIAQFNVPEPTGEGGAKSWVVINVTRVRVGRDFINRTDSVHKNKTRLAISHRKRARRVRPKRAGPAPEIASIPRAHDGPLEGWAAYAAL
jgi:hypothetical protein